MYFTFFLPYAAGHYSIMDVCYIDSHLDPFHKIRLGWLQPTIVRRNGTHYLSPIEIGGDAYILMDPQHGEQEYYIVENRQRALKYDSQIADSGLAVWHIMEDPAVYGALAAPPGVSSSDWATIPPGDWGRRAIRMIRPVYGPPFDDSKALWDGADPLTGYDLFSEDRDPAHAELRWADGNPSGFAIRSISPATGVMEVTFELPASATGTGEHQALPVGFVLYQNYPNPFNPSTTIKYELPLRSHVTLSVFNTLGQKVTTLFHGEQEAGYHDVQFDARNLASGVYLYRMQAGDFVQTKKLVVVH